MPRALIAIGILLLALGLGRLPGDIAIECENFRFYFPISMSIVISVVLSLVISEVGKVRFSAFKISVK